MEDDKKIKNCVSKQVKNITTQLTLGNQEFEFCQRKMSVGETNKYRNLSSSIYDDPAVFEALMNESEALVKYKKEQRLISTSIKQVLERMASLIKESSEDLDDTEKEEKNKKIQEYTDQIELFNTELKTLESNLSPETVYEIQKATSVSNRVSFDLDKQFIAFSLTPSKYWGAYCKNIETDEIIKDEIIDEETKENPLMDILTEIHEEDFNKLLAQARALQNPSKEDIEEGKHI